MTSSPGSCRPSSPQRRDDYRLAASPGNQHAGHDSVPGYQRRRSELRNPADTPIDAMSVMNPHILLRLRDAERFHHTAQSPAITPVTIAQAHTSSHVVTALGERRTITVRKSTAHAAAVRRNLRSCDRPGGRSAGGCAQAGSGECCCDAVGMIRDPFRFAVYPRQLARTHSAAPSRTRCLRRHSRAPGRQPPQLSLSGASGTAQAPTSPAVITGLAAQTPSAMGNGRRSTAGPA